VGGSAGSPLHFMLAIPPMDVTNSSYGSSPIQMEGYPADPPSPPTLPKTSPSRWKVTGRASHASQTAIRPRNLPERHLLKETVSRSLMPR
jgi:hypothetical protein